MFRLHPSTFLSASSYSWNLIPNMTADHPFFPPAYSRPVDQDSEGSGSKARYLVRSFLEGVVMVKRGRVGKQLDLEVRRIPQWR